MLTVFTAFSIVHVPDDGVSESSTLLPSIRGPASLAAQSLQQQQQQGAEGEEGSIWWTLVRAIFSAEGMLRMGLLAAMAATVGLAVARALEGVFSPGLVGGGGLLMILCLVANKRELRG